MQRLSNVMFLLALLSESDAKRGRDPEYHQEMQNDLQRVKPKQLYQDAPKKCDDCGKASDLYLLNISQGGPAANDKLEGLTDDQKHFRAMHAHRIPCPVISSLYKRGWLNPDEMGRVGRYALYKALQLVGTTPEASFFQSFGIAAYNESDKNQLKRDRLPGFEDLASEFTNRDRSAHRYVNIFRMNPGDFVNSQQLQHGLSTTVRDSRFDHIMKPVDAIPGKGLVLRKSSDVEELDDPEKEVERVRELRARRFNQWFTNASGVLNVTSGRSRKMYVLGLAQLLRDMKDHGDFSGEWSYDKKNKSEDQNIYKYHLKSTQRKPAYLEELSEWQPIFAWVAFLCAFGEGPKEDQSSSQLHLSEESMESLFLKSEFPTGNWTVKREWGMKEVDGGIIVDLGRSNNLGPGTLTLPDVYQKQVMKIMQGEVESFTRIGGRLQKVRAKVHKVAKIITGTNIKQAKLFSDMLTNLGLRDN